jgi:asparagine synthase (glutamine-hydrolysing)
MPLRRRLLSGDVQRDLNGHDPAAAIRAAHALADAGRPLDGMMLADAEVLLPDDFLVKVDRASMACGLEVRPPLLDHELLELAARVPAEFKVRGGETKWIFRRAVERWLPEETIRGPKHGFDVPVDAWLRGPLRPMFEDAVLGPQSRVAELLDGNAVAGLFRLHLSGRGRHGAVLWSLLVLARWADRYLAPPAPPRRV